MSKAYHNLSVRLEQAFDEIDSDIVMDLRSTDIEYAVLREQLTQMKQENPFISIIFKGAGKIHLSTEDHAVLVEYLKLYSKADNLERQHLYFRGHTDAFAYLKKINLL